jgi:hypothetical protein
MKPWRPITLGEARELGIPIRDELVISPVPRAPADNTGSEPEEAEEKK